MNNHLSILLLFSLTLTSCASTTIEKHPDGTFKYTSTRDSQLDELQLMRNPDTGELSLHINGADGRASPVVEAQQQLLQQMIEAAIKATLPK